MQRKLVSLLEQIAQVGFGFFMSLLVWTLFVVPVWDLEVTMLDNIGITGLFTVLSIARGYVFRRIFNHLTHRRTVYAVPPQLRGLDQ